jgi:hypothetical protein
MQHSYKQFSIVVNALSFIGLKKLVAAGTKWSKPKTKMYLMMCVELSVLLCGAAHAT